MFLRAAALGLAFLAFTVCAGPSRKASIQRSEYVKLDGAKVYLLIRGADRSNPVLLWLHGGPGGAERPLFRYFNGELEQHFTVAYWDQRGAGRSFDAKANPRDLTIVRHLADLDRIVDHLRSALLRNKIILAGHSWGAALGLLYGHTHPNKVAAVVAVNPLVSIHKQREAEFRFVVGEATRRGDRKALRTAEKIGAAHYWSENEARAMEKLDGKYGGVFHKKPARAWIVLRAMFSGIIWPWEIPRLIHANNVSLHAMNEELRSLDLTRSVPSIEVPVLFFLGRYDRHADARAAAAYFEVLRAPLKRLTWFEHSAHNIPFEESKLFNEISTREVMRILSQCPTDVPSPPYSECRRKSLESAPAAR